MKKLILAMVFVFATGTIMNAESKKINFEKEEYVQTCLKTAYDQANAIEDAFNVTLPIDKWSKIFRTLCRACEDSRNSQELTISGGQLEQTY